MAASNFMIKRIMRGYTQLQMSKELKKYGINCSQSELSLYETTDRKPRLETALVMAKILGCTVEELFGSEKEE